LSVSERSTDLDHVAEVTGNSRRHHTSVGWP
jgi:hypothetical protein